MKQLGYDPNDKSTDIETPTGIGNVACAAVLEFRHHDKPTSSAIWQRALTPTGAGTSPATSHRRAGAHFRWPIPITGSRWSM